MQDNAARQDRLWVWRAVGGGRNCINLYVSMLFALYKKVMNGTERRTRSELLLASGGMLALPSLKSIK
jgi:hypothetical protein